MQPITDFLEIENDNNIYHIKSLLEWRNKHRDYSDYLHEYFDENDLWQIDISLDKYNQPLSLPVFCDLTKKETFLWLFNQINRIINFSELENEYKVKMDEYYKIKKSNNNIEEWFEKHINYQRFYKTDYLDVYLNYPNPNHLRLYLLNAKNDRLYVNRKCFKYTIAFLELMAVYDTREDKALKNKAPLPNKTYPVGIIKDKFIQSCLECNPKIFYPYLQLDNVKTTWEKDSYYEFFRNSIYSMKGKYIDFKSEITKDSENKDVEIYEFFDKAYKKQTFIHYIKVTKDELILEISSPF